MSFLSVEELVELRKQKPNIGIYTYAKNTYDEINAINLPRGELTPVAAQDLLDRVKEATLAHKMLKVNRPWLLVDLAAKLDPKQPWLGFEVETGWNNKEEYAAAINELLDNHDHVVIDYEGHGQYPAEITFSPQNYNDFVDGTSQVQRFYKWTEEHNAKMLPVYGEMVGTHVNISTPAYRAGASDGVLFCINNAIYMMGYDGCCKAFGRHPYGLGHARSGGTHRWIEFKLFRTADTSEGFAKTVEVARRLAEVVEHLCTTEMARCQKASLNRYGNGPLPMILNLDKVLLGEETELKWDDDVRGKIKGAGWSIREQYEKHMKQNPV